MKDNGKRFVSKTFLDFEFPRFNICNRRQTADCNYVYRVRAVELVKNENYRARDEKFKGDTRIR